MRRLSSLARDQRGDYVIISAILLMAIIITSIGLAMMWGLPLVRTMDDLTRFENTKNLMLTLDEQIRLVVHEGKGSSRTLRVRITGGNIQISNNTIRYVIETPQKVLEPGAIIQESNLVIRVEKIGDYYRITEELFYDPTKIRIDGEVSLGQGFHTLKITNEGLDEDGRIVVRIRSV